MSSNLPKLDTADAVLEWAREVSNEESDYCDADFEEIAASLADCVRLRQAQEGEKDATIHFSKAGYDRFWENERLRKWVDEFLKYEESCPATSNRTARTLANHMRDAMKANP